MNQDKEPRSPLYQEGIWASHTRKLAGYFQVCPMGQKNPLSFSQICRTFWGRKLNWLSHPQVSNSSAPRETLGLSQERILENPLLACFA